MNHKIAFCFLIVTAGSLFTLSATHPFYLSDTNVFLKNFVTHELLGILGVILAITLASAAQIHLTLNRIEEDYKKVKFAKTRANIRQAASWLISLFGLAVVLLIVKANLATSDVASAYCNSLALLIIACEVLILIDITQLVFAIPAVIKEEGV